MHIDPFKTYKEQLALVVGKEKKDIFNECNNGLELLMAGRPSDNLKFNENLIVLASNCLSLRNILALILFVGNEKPK